MTQLEISTSICETRDLQECVWSTRFLIDNFKFVASNVIVSRNSFDEDEQDALGDLENETRSAFNAWGLQEYDIAQVEE